MIRSATSPATFMPLRQRLLRRVGVALVVGVLLAILGPFGSYANGGPLRLASYWIGSMLLGLLLYGSAYKIVSASVAPATQEWWAGLIGATLLASVPEALATRAGAFWLWPELAQHRLPLALWFAQTSTIAILCMLGMTFILRRVPTLPSGPEPAPPMPKEAGAPLGGTVLALQMEDYYVRVHRPTGSELLLMPLGRAIAGMQTEGLQIHRSWWVAHNAVTAVEGNARSMRVHLANGLAAPVARSAVTRLRAAGWIEGAEGDGRVQELEEDHSDLR